jgi:hypothetical protein
MEANCEIVAGEETMINIYLDFPDDIQLTLEDNQFSWEDALNNLGIDQEVSYGLLPYQEEAGVRTKELVAVIIVASAAAVVAVSFAISHILEILQRKPRIVEVYEPIAVQDASGKVVLDASSQPVVRLVKCYEILEPRKENRKGEFEFHFDLKDGVVIKVRSEENQMSTKETKGAPN